MNKLKSNSKRIGGKASLLFLAFILINISANLSAQNLLPFNYWTFEGRSVKDIKTINVKNKNIACPWEISRSKNPLKRTMR